MAVDSLAKTAARILERGNITNQVDFGKGSTIQTEVTASPDTVKESKQAKPSAREAVKRAKLRRERVELVKHLYNTINLNRHRNISDSASLSDNESLSEQDEWLDFYDHDFKFQRRKSTNIRRTKRERIPLKEQKFIDFCREFETPENITLERGRKKAIRVKFYKCTKQMTRDSNCREQNIDRKANIEKRLRKLGLKRLEEYLSKRRPKEDNPAAEKYALREENVPKEMQDIVDFLLELQDREITPEDYEYLLQLDESVPTKTVSDQRLASLREESASEEHLNEICGICMENYELGQTRKVLPCEHVFHSHCIDTWLGESSTKCPLDGQEL